MKKCRLANLLCGCMLSLVMVSATEASNLAPTRANLSPPATIKPIVFRMARPLRFHTAYYCPENAMYYPQTLACMGPWTLVRY